MLAITNFVAACCRWPPTQDTKDCVAQAATEVDNWEGAKNVIQHHRVTPLVHLAVKDLTTIPPDFRAWAKKGAEATARYAMRLTRECSEMDTALKDAGLKPLHFKGPVLAQVAYGSVALKFSRDLDIFVTVSEVSMAVAVLEASGYRAFGQDSPVSARQITASIRNLKDLVMIGPTGTVIEIHWKFGYNKNLLTGLENNLRPQPVIVADVALLHTFDSTQMLSYLSVHGATHHWNRIKWLADFAAFLANLTPEQRDQAIAEVIKGPTSDALAHALHLCDTLLGTKYAPAMSHRALALYNYALIRIDQPDIPHKRFWGDIRFIEDVAAMRHLYPTLWSTIWALKSHLVCRADIMALPLPAYLNGIYPFIRLPSFLLRRLRG